MSYSQSVLKNVPAVLQLADGLKIQAQVIGHTDASTVPARNQVVVTAANGEVIEY